VAQAAPLSTACYKIENGILYRKDKFRSYWTPYLPSNLESKVIRFFYFSLGQLGTDKHVAQTAHSM
jgi:hypothetical protein